jgi:putative aminopeptidase
MRIWTATAALTLLGTSAVRVSAQATAHPIAGWIGLDAQAGEERAALAWIKRADARWQADAQGNLILRAGTGTPRRVIACTLDHTTYVVSAITPDGYLRLHRNSATGVHPLWDQSHQGQQVVVRTVRGLVPGVVAIPNGHFARQHRGDTSVVHVDDLWVDVGARTRADVDAMGIALIDPVRRDVPPWSYANFIAGADASGRVGCAAVAAVAAADTAEGSGERVYVMSTLRAFTNQGLTGALTRVDSIGELTIVTGAASTRNGSAVNEQPIRWTAAQQRAVGDLTGKSIAVRARWIGTQVESVDTSDARMLKRTLANIAGVDDSPWVALDTSLSMAMPQPPRSDGLDPLAGMLRRFADLPGVPGHEFRVRDAVLDALPQWARRKAEVDTAGNVFFAVGPARDTVVVMAHMDEVSYVVTGLRRDGTVTLEGRGGVANSAWEGQPALLHFDPTESGTTLRSLRGVFVPRDSALLRVPRTLTAWFGLDSAALVARGVGVGAPVTAYKRAERIGPTRFTGRALDDRAGTVALLRSLIGLDASKLDRTVIFAWTTREEGGLLGATALASAFGPNTRRVYAVDTFVSSDTPLERPTFAYAPLGSGAVLRALDDGTMTIRSERERIMAIARAAGIPLQIGTTQGSTDATPFSRYGALAAGLSWPGRYSHTPGEVLDLRDVEALARLIRAVVSAPSR